MVGVLTGVARGKVAEREAGVGWGRGGRMGQEVCLVVTGHGWRTLVGICGGGWGQALQEEIQDV